MRRILFPIGEKELQATQGRLLHVVQMLARAGNAIDVLTYSEEVAAKAEAFSRDAAGISVRLVKARKLLIPYSFRDDLLKTFIKQTHHLIVPETDMRIYKLAAFDDFWGHIDAHAYQDIDITPYRLIVMPLLSEEDSPPPECSVFYSSMCLLAREKNIPLVGLQIYPVVHTPPLFAKSMNYVVIKEEHERDYLRTWGVADERIFLVTEEKEAYCLSTIEDTYRNLMLNSGVETDRDELCITVINHPRFRAVVRNILSIIAPMNVKKLIFLVKRGYAVKELSEDDIINDMYAEVIKRIKGRAYVLEPEIMARIIMTSDVVISPSYITPLRFAAAYGRCSVVYNPLYERTASRDGVVVIDEPTALEDALMSCYRRKTSLTSLCDIVATIFTRRRHTCG